MEKSKYYRSAVTAGLLMGGIMILYSMILYVLEVNVFSIGFGLINFLLSVGIIVTVMVVSGINVRKKVLGGYMAYKDAFIFTLVVGITGALLMAVYNYFYQAYADLSYLQLQMDEFLAKMQQRGLSEAQLQDLYKQMNEQFAMSPAKQMLNGLLYSGIMSVVIALLVSIFIKQNRPEYEENGI